MKKLTLKDTKTTSQKKNEVQLPLLKKATIPKKPIENQQVNKKPKTTKSLSIPSLNSPNTNTNKSLVSNSTNKNNNNKSQTKDNSLIDSNPKINEIIENIHKTSSMKNINKRNNNTLKKDNTKQNNRNKSFKSSDNNKNNISLDQSIKQINNINMSVKNFSKPVIKISNEKLQELQEKRNKRLIKEQKDFEIQEKILDEQRKVNNILRKDREKLFNNFEKPKIEYSQKKAQSILEDGGIIEAYKYLIKHLCQLSTPPQNIYDYSSEIIKKYEKIWRIKKFKLLNEKIEKHFENKKQNYLKGDISNQDNIKIYKVLERREENKFIKNLDKSRSMLHITSRNNVIPLITKKNENISADKEALVNKSADSNQNNKKNSASKSTVTIHQKDKNDNKIYFNIKLKADDETKEESENQIKRGFLDQKNKESKKEIKENSKVSNSETNSVALNNNKIQNLKSNSVKNTTITKKNEVNNKNNTLSKDKNLKNNIKKQNKK